MEKRIVVPQGMLEAARLAYQDRFGSLPAGLIVFIEAALRWLSENPMVPSEADIMGILQQRVASGHISGDEYCAIPPATVRYVVREWQRRMFDAPESKVPEEINPQAALEEACLEWFRESHQNSEAAFIEAHRLNRLGRKSKEK